MNRQSAPEPNAGAYVTRTRPSPYAWLVLALALVFGLLLSDYMSRQVLSAVYPLLKSDWQHQSALHTIPGCRRRAK